MICTVIFMVPKSTVVSMDEPGICVPLGFSSQSQICVLLAFFPAVGQQRLVLWSLYRSQVYMSLHSVRGLQFPVNPATSHLPKFLTSITFINIYNIIWKSNLIPCPLYRTPEMNKLIRSKPMTILSIKCNSEAKKPKVKMYGGRNFKYN